MTYIFVQGFSAGWSLAFRPTLDRRFEYPEEPVFVRFHHALQVTEERTPAELAAMEEGRSVFHELKRWLDEADRRMGNDANQQPTWRAADKAKAAMEAVLRGAGVLDRSLMQNEIVGG